MSRFNIAQRALSEECVIFADKREELILADEIKSVLETIRSTATGLTRNTESHLTSLHELLKNEVDAPSSQTNGVATSSIDILNDCERRCKAMELRSVELDKEILMQQGFLKGHETERQQLCAEKEDLEKHADSSNDRCLINLYGSTTKVRFDIDAEPNKVVGFVAGSNHIATFDLDTNENSQYFIANKIWDLMLPVHTVH